MQQHDTVPLLTMSTQGSILLARVRQAGSRGGVVLV